MKWFANVRNNKRIDIPEIDGWIEVREELSIGEERNVFAGAIRGQTTMADGLVRTDYDHQKVTFGMVVSHLTDWSARDEHDKPVPLSEDAIHALEPSVYNAIEKAVNAHAEQVRAAKKIPQRPSTVVPISPSAA